MVAFPLQPRDMVESPCHIPLLIFWYSMEEREDVGVVNLLKVGASMESPKDYWTRLFDFWIVFGLVFMMNKVVILSLMSACSCFRKEDT